MRVVSLRPHPEHSSVCFSQPRIGSTRISRSGRPHWRQNGLSLGSGERSENAVPQDRYMAILQVGWNLGRCVAASFDQDQART